jgi:adenylate cyclase
MKENGAQKESDLNFIHRLKRYFSPQIAEVVLRCPDDDSLWESHWQEVTVVVLDLRGFTRFANDAEPHEVMALLRSYHAEMGRLVFKFQGTLERFTGDGIMVFFNEPGPCEQHTKKAVAMAIEMRDCGKELRKRWLKKGYDLDLGIGLAAGYATVGNFGFEGRMDYGAVGKVTNLTYRLCEEARGGQILTNQQTLCTIEGCVHAEPVENLHLKGFSHPIKAFNIVGIKS